MRKILIICTIIFLSFQIAFTQDKLNNVLSEELNRNMTELKKHENAPYFISYRVKDVYKANITAEFGAISKKEENNTRYLTIDVRVGDYKLDNTHEIRGDYGEYFSSSSKIKIPYEFEKDAIQQALWRETDNAYKNAMDKYNKVKANIAVKVDKEDQSDDFSKEKPEKYFEKEFTEEQLNFDFKTWQERLKKFSAPFLDEPAIISCSASMTYKAERKYFVSTEGAEIAQNMTFTRIYVNGRVKADDGMIMPLGKSYFAYDPKDLPSEEQIIKDIKKLVKKLTMLKDAPVVEPYQGPAILSAEASGVFFHEIFGHRVEGQRLKKESDGQTFKKKVGKLVLPEEFNVYFDPTIREYEKQNLNGSYIFDDQGVRGKKVEIVNNGILKGFLMSRSPIENFYNSNGHGRAEEGKQIVTRQSNLIVETKKPYTEDELRKMLIEELKTQGLKYGYLFTEVTGGFTMTGRFIPNSFNVTPTEVYKIYTDGSPDELVRGVDLVGTPLAMFSEIAAAGNKSKIFTGTCGAESGRVPVTGVSPSLFVKKIEMQKKSKSQDKPAILTRPDKNNKNL